MSDAADRELSSAIGGEIRRRRTLAGLSTRALAELAGVSQPFLSQVERGASVPSMASVYRIARALGARPGDLLPAVGPGDVTLVRADEGRRIPVADRADAALGRALILRDASSLEIVEWTIEPGEFVEEWFESPGETAIYVVTGALEVEVFGAETYRLGPGDLIHFPAGTRDLWRHVGEETTRVLMAASVTSA